MDSHDHSERDGDTQMETVELVEGGPFPQWVPVQSDDVFQVELNKWNEKTVNCTKNVQAHRRLFQLSGE
jgi:hypothetical protein